MGNVNDDIDSRVIFTMPFRVVSRRSNPTEEYLVDVGKDFDRLTNNE